MKFSHCWCFAIVVVAISAISADAQSLPNVTTGTLRLRLDAAQGVTTSGGLVTQWNDQSGNGNNFNQATASDRPALVASALNGLPTVRFTTDDLNVIGAGLNFGAAQPFTFFAVTAGGTNPRGLFDSAPSQPNVFRHYPDNNVELWSNSPNIGFTLHSGGSVVSTSAYINNALRNLTNREFSTAGGLVGVGAVNTNTANVLFQAPNIGSINNDFPTGAYGGDVSEMLIYQGQMSVADRFAVEVYLRNKYNVNPAAVGSTQQLPNPVIAASATPFSASFRAENAQDGNLATDYASAGLGAATFMDFNFGGPTLITRVDYYDRATGGPVGTDNVTAFDLIFSNDAIFGNSDDTTVNVLSPGFAAPDLVTINNGVGLVAQYMRWDVVSTTGANPGAAEFRFFTTVTPEPVSVVMWLALGSALATTFVWHRRSK